MSGFRMVASLDHFIYINNKKFLIFLCIKQSRLINHSKTGLKCPVFEWSCDYSNGHVIIQKPTFKMSGFRMFPVFECPVFGSPLYFLAKLRTLTDSGVACLEAENMQKLIDANPVIRFLG